MRHIMRKLSQKKNCQATELALTQTKGKEQNVGRAIDMENDITKLKQEVKKVKDVLQEILNEVKKDEKKKTNVKGSTKSNRKSNNASTKAGGDGSSSK
tara:strand:+ start:120 stop:413 length:294 start_codon:yes stop_codon:yes gene_type:complete